MYTVRITKIERMGKSYANIYFKPKISAYPGQFVMVNVFGYEEIPLSLSLPNCLTVKAVGETTHALINSKIGQLLGMRGPFGKPFTPSDRVLMIAGGIGIAPLRFLYHFLKDCKSQIKIIYGVKTAKDAILTEEFDDITITTEDGSFGIRGTVLTALQLEDLSKYSKIYCCGPQEMIKAVYEFTDDAGVLNKTEFSLESYMRCGIGVCGSCVIDGGLRVCTDGPVFKGDDLHW